MTPRAVGSGSGEVPSLRLALGRRGEAAAFRRWYFRRRSQGGSPRCTEQGRLGGPLSARRPERRLPDSKRRPEHDVLHPNRCDSIIRCQLDQNSGCQPEQSPWLERTGDRRSHDAALRGPAIHHLERLIENNLFERPDQRRSESTCRGAGDPIGSFMPTLRRQSALDGAESAIFGELEVQVAESNGLGFACTLPVTDLDREQ